MRWPDWLHTPASLVRDGLREGNTWQGIILLLIGAALLSPETAHAVAERLNGAREIMGSLGDGAASAAALWLLFRRQDGATP